MLLPAPSAAAAMAAALALETTLFESTHRHAATGPGGRNPGCCLDVVPRHDIALGAGQPYLRRRGLAQTVTAITSRIAAAEHAEGERKNVWRELLWPCRPSGWPRRFWPGARLARRRFRPARAWRLGLQRGADRALGWVRAGPHRRTPRAGWPVTWRRGRQGPPPHCRPPRPGETPGHAALTARRPAHPPALATSTAWLARKAIA